MGYVLSIRHTGEIIDEKDVLLPQDFLDITLVQNEQKGSCAQGYIGLFMISADMSVAATLPK